MAGIRMRVIWLAAAGVAAAAAPLAAQVVTAKPIVIKEVKPKPAKFQGEVLHATNAAITVRSRENERVLRTFTYTPKVREQMLEIIDKGGYQYGDKVEIKYDPITNVAVRIKGKPSKPL